LEEDFKNKEIRLLGFSCFSLLEFSSKEMFPAAMSNSTSLSEEASVSSGTRVQDFGGLNPQQPQKIKKKRSLPGNPGKIYLFFIVLVQSLQICVRFDLGFIMVFVYLYGDGVSDPDAEVIALSPKTLLATNRFVCEICNKGFQRDQNLQLHRRGHNLPWKLKQRSSKEIKKRAYVCPEPSCVHHHPSRALGDLTGIKKHFCRKHGEKKWKCEKCSKIYAVQSDWKAHSKTCGTREYRCDCGTLFSRFFLYIIIINFLPLFFFFFLWGLYILCLFVTKSQTFPSFEAFLAIIHHFGLDIIHIKIVLCLEREVFNVLRTTLFLFLFLSGVLFCGCSYTRVVSPCMKYIIRSLDSVAACMKVETINTSACSGDISSKTDSNISEI
jgi:hypothetical protein